MPVKGHSVIFAYGNQSSYTASTTWTDIAGLLEITPPKLKADDIDVSHMLTPDQIKEFEAGWAEGGEAELKIQFEADQAEDVYGLFRITKGYRVTFVNGATWKLTGYINEFGDEVDREGVITTSIKVKVSGKPLYTKPPAPPEEP